jgi:hypothetical protein
MDKTYWNNSGKYMPTADALHTLVPAEGSVKEPRKNPKLERFRKAVNCYYDLYNNGLCNRVAEFRQVFGIQSSRYKISYGDYGATLYMRVEECMNQIIIEAAAEQGIPLEEFVANEDAPADGTGVVA